MFLSHTVIPINQIGIKLLYIKITMLDCGLPLLYVLQAIIRKSIYLVRIKGNGCGCKKKKKGEITYKKILTIFYLISDFV